MSLKPIDDFERGLLAALGETAESHQKQVLWQTQFKGKTSTKKREPTARELLSEVNTLFEKKHTFTVPISELTAKVEEAAKAEPVLIPQAYVMFIREWHCVNCDAEGSCMDMNQIFLEHKVQGKDESARVFKPTNTFIDPLPYRRIIEVTDTTLCHNCFGDKTKWPQQTTLAQQESLPPPAAGSDSTSTEPSRNIPDGSDPITSEHPYQQWSSVSEAMSPKETLFVSLPRDAFR